MVWWRGDGAVGEGVLTAEGPGAGLRGFYDIVHLIDDIRETRYRIEYFSGWN